MFEKVFDNGVTVRVGTALVSAWTKEGALITNSNVDYYYEEEGYNCQNEEEVADQYFRNFCDQSLEAVFSDPDPGPMVVDDRSYDLID